MLAVTRPDGLSRAAERDGNMLDKQPWVGPQTTAVYAACDSWFGTQCQLHGKFSVLSLAPRGPGFESQLLSLLAFSLYFPICKMGIVILPDCILSVLLIVI